MARSTKDILGFDPKSLDDDALLAALTPKAPDVPTNYFSDHKGAMEFEPSCECPTCNAAATYQAAYAEYEKQIAQFKPDALPAMVAKRVARIEQEKAKTAYELACEPLIERGINIIPDSECIDRGDYVVWKNWTPQMRLWLDRPIAVTRYYETLARAASSYGCTMERVVEERRRELIYAHPLKPVRVEGFMGVEGNRSIYEHFIDGSRQYRREFRDGTHYDNDSQSTTMGGFRENMKRILTVPKALRLHVIRQRLESLYNRNAIDHATYKRRIESAQLLVNSSDSSGVVHFHSQVYLAEYFPALKAHYKQAGMLIRNQTDDSAVAFIALVKAASATISSTLGRQLVAKWNNRAGSTGNDDLQLRKGDCGHYHTQSGGHSTHNGTVCTACFHQYYEFAIDLDAYIHRDNGSMREFDEDNEDHLDENGDVFEDGFYSSSFGREPDESTVGGLVRNYTHNVLNVYQKDTTFTPTIYGDILMGVELEVATKSKNKILAVKHTQKNLCADYAIMKNDGSLPLGGFEIVTAPRSLKEHVERFSKWTPHEDMHAWDAKVCGLHVHLSSASFSAGTLGKFLEFINKIQNSSIIMAVAGRVPESDNNAAQYCRREGAMVIGNPKKTLYGKATQRYQMVNTCNLSPAEGKRLGLTNHEGNGKAIETVELRIFRASLKKGRLLAQIEFAHAAVMFCRQASFRELEKDHFVKWLRQSAGMYPNLAKWFGVKANTMTVIEAPQVCTDAEV